MFQLLPSYGLSFSLGSMLGLDWVVGAPEAAGGSLSLWAHSARVASALAAVHLLVPPPCSVLCVVCAPGVGLPVQTACSSRAGSRSVPRAR